MPNDLYKWEKGGGLVHHCPQCFTPLTQPSTRTRCLGEHVEWCKRYHTQLFKKGTSGTCDPCNRTDEEHLKRHRDMAKLLHDLKELKADQQPGGSPLTPKAFNTVANHHTPETESPLRKKERKANKKRAKHGQKSKGISTADIEFVAKVLHPGELEVEDADIEHQLLNDPDIGLNRAFHRGTSNCRETRSIFVKKDKDSSSKATMHVDVEDIDGLLQLLNVSPLTPASSREERDKHADLRACIENDLVRVSEETEKTMMRKGGFWRWASKKAYKRLVENGRIWGQKEYDGASVSTGTKSKKTTSASSATSAGGVNEENDDSTQPDTDVTTPSDEEAAIEAAVEGFTLDAETNSTCLKHPRTCNSKRDEDDGWTMVGKASKAKHTPVGNLKLAHNGGLAKLASPVTPTGRRAGFGVLED